MARRDLTNEEIDQMSREEPGSAAEYLRLRREELDAEKQAEREKDDYKRFEEAFVEAGGSKGSAKEAYTRRRNEEAEKAALEADRASSDRSRRHVARAL